MISCDLLLATPFAGWLILCVTSLVLCDMSPWGSKPRGRTRFFLQRRRRLLGLYVFKGGRRGDIITAVFPLASNDLEYEGITSTLR